MLFRCLLLLVCLTAICAQKGGDRRPSASSPSRILAGRKIPQPSEPIQQVKEPEDPEDRRAEEDTRDTVAVLPRRPPPRLQPQPFIPVRQPIEDPGHPAPEPYSFSYAVDDPESGANTARQETQDINGEIIGFYLIKDAEGRSRRVDYTAGKDGFKATIKSNEEGLAARDPADVNIELSASPSENRYAYSPNQRQIVRQPVAFRPVALKPIARADPIIREPEASESTVQNYGRPPQQKFFQRLISAPAPQPLEQKTEESQIEQRAENQISQSYETSDPSESEIVQQKSVDEEEVPVESAPVKGGPSPSVSVYRPTERPIGQFTPQRTQIFRENGLVNLQPVLNRISQVREEIPNSIQDTQTPAETSAPLPSPPTKSVAPPQPTYQALRPLATPALYQWQQPVATVPNLAPIQPVSNNIVFQHREHRQPISQERLLNYLQPLTYAPQIVYPPALPQPIQVSYPRYQAQPLNSGYQVSIQHRETQPISQVRTGAQRIQNEFKSETRIPEVRPLPSPPVIEQKAEESFEPQVYEPIQQTYEPLQQEAEDPAEESRIDAPKPPCKCDEPQQESIPQPVKSNNIQASEPAPVKSGRLSPSRAFIPQAFRTR